VVTIESLRHTTELMQVQIQFNQVQIHISRRHESPWCPSSRPARPHAHVSLKH
jgi:hypothetical protein